MPSTQENTEHVLRERLALAASTSTVTRNDHLAEDVYQEIFVKAVALHDKFTSNTHLTNWFRVSARSRAIDIIRTRETLLAGDVICPQTRCESATTAGSFISISTSEPTVTIFASS
jgi:DNA-directed RNA polymerase specialized sigma24 family protein